MKILVADDSRTNLSLLTSSLEVMGHVVDSVTNGQDAINSYIHHKPDLIILDVMMDGMSGFECAKKIRAINENEWIPIIFLSASVDDTSISEGIDAGGDDYLTKPCSEVTLKAKIKAMQRIADMRQELFNTTQKLYLLSSTDALTGIYNRFQFDRSIKEIIHAANKYQNTSALFFIDLDNFKSINDTFGHHVGDLLLKEVVNRIRSCLKSSDFFSRLGGDEFSIIMAKVESLDEVENVAKEILSTLSRDYYLDGHNIKNGASIGIAYYPTTASNQEDWVLCADLAMYHAKNSGRNNYKVFSEDLNDKYKQQISLEHALKFALERKELYLTYQPIYDLKETKIVGAEALVCWEHPKFGLVSPNIFIPLAEETGLMKSIGDWILQQVCDEAETWPINEKDEFKLAINISSCQLHQQYFYEDFISKLEVCNIKPKNIELELTETAIMTYTTGSFKETITKLHDAGISISIDDFGTGYSSLIRLKYFPFNTLKIEKMFVQDAVKNDNSAIIVRCLIALGNNLGLNVIAEGIETEKQLKFLVDNGCKHGQGYYLCKPMKSNEMVKTLKIKEKNSYE